VTDGSVPKSGTENAHRAEGSVVREAENVHRAEGSVVRDLKTIGIVRSGYTREIMPPLGAPGIVEVFPEFADGLLHLEKHTHLWVLAWMDGASRDPLQVTPRGVRDLGEAGKHGVFAVRSPSRPNPIGLTAARITGRNANLIHLDPLDFADGTPVIDLKPYFSTRDLIFSARSVQIGRPASIEAVRDSATMQALAFNGESSPGLELAIAIVTHFRTEVLGFVDPEEWEFTVPFDRPRLAQALTGLTRTWPQFHSRDAVVFRLGGSAYEYELHEDDFRFYPH
jgi:tRNA-Thr(GGU) m(6)t(6)A37 methyltransferase TsaA